MEVIIVLGNRSVLLLPLNINMSCDCADKLSSLLLTFDLGSVEDHLNIIS